MTHAMFLPDAGAVPPWVRAVVAVVVVGLVVERIVLTYRRRK
ncbi:MULTISPECIES: hypothetical protein [Streptomyces]|uniref:Uncharacterized protein n=2 Tax=Streptomyces TaxID=1883 RepID=A0ABU2QRR3_9ACTN|nr:MULTISPECIES: hypothetical protein [unclassified Streptomyces]MDT0407142.1 hypothetical protein [Streptomyces sp. DSM 41635]MDT0476224.1 hypothetical protein [Streptomyces sp. DSM 41014]